MSASDAPDLGPPTGGVMTEQRAAVIMEGLGEGEGVSAGHAPQTSAISALGCVCIRWLCSVVCIALCS